jgi:hypothetical protein
MNVLISTELPNKKQKKTKTKTKQNTNKSNNFPAKNVNGAGKCKKMKCGKKGPKPVKKSKGIFKQMNLYLIIITASEV